MQNPYEAIANSNQAIKIEQTSQIDTEIEQTNNFMMPNTNNKLTYSQIVQKDASISNITEMKTDYTETWTQQVNDNLKAKINTPFNRKEWSYNSIIEAYKSKEKMQAFIKHKLQTKPTERPIPPASEAKFRHTDPTFFTTFTHAKKFMPPH